MSRINPSPNGAPKEISVSSPGQNHGSEADESATHAASGAIGGLSALFAAAAGWAFGGLEAWSDRRAEAQARRRSVQIPRAAFPQAATRKIAAKRPQ